MAYKVAIDSENKTNNKDYPLLMSRYISNRLSTLGIDNFLVRKDSNDITNSNRVDIIKNKYGNGNNIIVLSNRNSDDNIVDIVYPLRNNSILASKIADELKNVTDNEIRYYQLRNSADTSKDDDYIIRNTANNLTIAIDYGNVNDNNYENLAESVVKAISDFAGITYYPINNDLYYIVQKGDSLWSIASKKGTSVDILKALNNLKSNTLSIGQLLKLPTSTSSNNAPATPENIYIVKKGDSLWVIANKYNTTVDNIKKANNLTSNLLSIGQTLTIPSSQNYLTYVVQKGDSLWVIANKYNTTVDKIKKLNNLTSNLLSIGQKLFIPS